MPEHADTDRGGPNPPNGPSEDLLSSWKEIAVYLGTTVRSVQRWERDAKLPVRRVFHKKKASVYAFKSEIEEWRVSRDVSPELSAGLSPSLPDHPTPVFHATRFGGRFRTGLAVGVVFAVIAVAIVGYRWNVNPRASPEVTLLTSLEGVEFSPTFSPDGSRVAFSWMRPGRRDYDIYVAGIDGGTPEPLAETDSPEISPAWSRDGEKIAFLRVHRRGPQESADIVILSLDSREEEVLSTMGAAPPRPIEWLTEPYLTWTADGEGLILASGDFRTGRQGIFRFDIRTQNLDRLTSSPEGFLGDYAPNLSPDGRLLTFVRKSGMFLSDVFVQNLEDLGTPPERLTS